MKKAVLIVGLMLALMSVALGQGTALQMRAWQGDSVAMLELSEAFRFGKGVALSEDSAKAYLKKSSDRGNADAQYLYGTTLMTDVFNATTYGKGVGLLKKSAEKGNASAQYRLSEVHMSKGRNNVSDTYYDVKKAYAYADMAAQQGLPEALLFCAEARLKGQGTTKNDSIAVAYFRRAAVEKNNVTAIIRMGDMYWEGKVTGKPEPYLAKEWYDRALAQKHANLDQRGKADHGIYLIDQFFKRIQNTFMDANPAVPMSMFSYRLR